MTTYYMRADGTAANKAAATSDAAANTSMNISVHNGETFVADDVIMVSDAGGVYRARMTIPSSGSSGQPIIYQNNISGSPIIDGAELVSGFVTHYDNLLANADFINWTDATVPDGWTKEGTHDVNNFVQESPADDLNLVSDGTYTGIFESTYALVNATTYNYRFKIDVITGSVRLRFGGSGSDTAFSTVATHVGSQLKGVGDNKMYIIRNASCDVDIDTFELSLQNYWEIDLTTEPTAVWFDGTIGDKKASVAACVNEFDWFWGGNVLVVYSTTDPDSAYTTVEAVERDQCLDTIGASYITFDGLKFANAMGTTGAAVEVNAGSNVTIQNCVFSNISQWHIMYILSNNSLIDNNTFTSNVPDADTTFGRRPLSMGVFGQAWGSSDCIFTNNIITGCLNGSLFYDTDTLLIADNVISDCGGTACFMAEATNVIIEDNEFSDTCKTVSNSNALNIGGSDLPVLGVIVRRNIIHTVNRSVADGSGIEIDTGTIGCEVYNNIVHTTDGPGIVCFKASDVQIYYNLIYDVALDPVTGQESAIRFNESFDVDFYNNIVHMPTTAGFKFLSPGGVGGTHDINVKNNIIVGSTTFCIDIVDDDSIVNLDFDHNDYFFSTGKMAKWHDATEHTTLADWVSARSQDANSIDTDPLFTNAAGQDFTLQTGSSAIDAGTDVSLTLDFAGTVVPFGSLPDIGAYEWTSLTIPIAMYHHINNSPG